MLNLNPSLVLVSILFVLSMSCAVASWFAAPRHARRTDPRTRPDLDLSSDPLALTDVTCRPGSQPIPKIRMHVVHDRV